MNNNSISIELKNVTKNYKMPKGEHFQALKPLNLTIKSGECFALLGHNGAGKTTIISLLAGVNKPTTGDVFINGLSVTNNSEKTKRMIGVVQQELIADSFFNLPTMLSIQSKLSGVKPDKNWINFLLEKLQLLEHSKKTTRELSGGMKRRMMIARSLVHKPQILILDEPTAGVDIQLRQSMWKFIEELHQNGLTIILTTHYLQEAEDFCSRIAIMKNGEIVTLKENKELLSLGGKHRVSCLIEVPNVKQWIETNSKYLKENSIIFESVKNVSSSTGDLKISINYEQGEMSSFLTSSRKLSEISNKLHLRISEIFTESPGLEEVYMKINDGNIKI
ncbi:ABC transporter ATP-binding protein [Fluviispira multicolorata]|uniref:ATP-binding cassette domain-containing protein n=1 Tax=Fluviispira multicolorata TaxID=2654512 RepID=A0A833N0G0_9BACT|nr:ABC transporter ATP-binding protein [Fluviispira multicolorata]KAB8028532.1 ATP-binding cassette domain-containing protein [Fluviispira multicolorata]